MTGALRHRYIVVGMGLVLVAAFSLGADPTTAPAQDDSDSNQTARSLVEKILGEVTAILHNSQLNKAQRRDEIRNIAYEHIDFETLSRLTLGHYWRDITDAQKADFIDAFKKHLSATYAHATDDYTNEQLSVTGDREESNGDWTVKTQIVGTNQQDNRQAEAKVDYRLRKKDNQWKVIDVVIDNASLVANFRAQFQDIMSNGGIDKLIKLLREKDAADEQ